VEIEERTELVLFDSGISLKTTGTCALSYYIDGKSDHRFNCWQEGKRWEAQTRLVAEHRHPLDK
jgi:hypothetical protein